MASYETSWPSPTCRIISDRRTRTFQSFHDSQSVWIFGVTGPAVSTSFIGSHSAVSQGNGPTVFSPLVALTRPEFFLHRRHNPEGIKELERCPSYQRSVKHRPVPSHEHWPLVLVADPLVVSLSRRPLSR